MKAIWAGGLGLALGLSSTLAWADDTGWRPVIARSHASQPEPTPTSPIPVLPPPAYAAPLGGDAAQGPTVTLGQPIVTLGKPVPSGTALGTTSTSYLPEPQVIPASYDVPVPEVPAPIIRTQAVDAPPPSPPPGAGVAPAVPPPVFAQPLPPSSGPVFIGGGVGDERYNSGAVSGGPESGGFWDKCKGFFSNGLGDSASGRGNFQSDHCFDYMISPVTNPSLFEDPRSLTELRPVFIYQSIPKGNPATHGGSIEFFGLQGRLALTDRWSIVMNKLGGIAIQPDVKSPGIADSTGFAELQIGPKFTFLRNEQTKTLVAAGLTFQLPVGDKSVFQDTGNLGLVPYISAAQNFWKTSYGSFNALGTLGYQFGVDNARSDNLFTSLHLNFNVGNNNVIYPFLEMNWFYYTNNGNGAHPQTFGFEGRDLFNFGSKGVSGHDELSLAFGARFKLNERWQFGGALEFPLTGSKDTNDFRLTLDLIFRY